MYSRTGKMLQEMLNNHWDLREDHQYVEIHGKKYRILSRNVHDFHSESIIYPSPADREIIILDPESSFLQQRYKRLLKTLENIKNTEAIFEQAMKFVKETFNKTTPFQLKDLINRYFKHTYKNHALIYLDHYIYAGEGVCRHHTLYLAYLLSRLMHDNILPKATLYCHRDRMSATEGHVWIMLKIENPHQLYLLDCFWYEKPYLLEGDLEKNETLLKYGKQIAKNCKNRYSAQLMDFSDKSQYVVTEITFSHNNELLAFRLGDGNKSFYYFHGKPLGSGHHGNVFEMFPTDPEAPAFAVKYLFPPLKYSAKASSREILKEVAGYFTKARHEAKYNQMIDGFGIYYPINGKDFDYRQPIQPQLKVKNGIPEYQTLRTPPQAFIVIKKANGICVDEYRFRSALHYLDFCIAAIESLQKIHAQLLVHSDIHGGNVLVEDTNSGVLVHFIDMSLCGYEGSYLSTDDLELDIKPPEFRYFTLIARDPTQDIYCLGLLFKNKYNSDFFDDDFQQQHIEHVLTAMMAKAPEDRMTSDVALTKLKQLKAAIHELEESKDYSLANSANAYLKHIVHTPKNFPLCLKELSPRLQLHLFNQGSSDILRSLVMDRIDCLEIMAATSHAALFVEKIGHERISRLMLPPLSLVEFFEFKIVLKNKFGKEQAASILKVLMDLPYFFKKMLSMKTAPKELEILIELFPDRKNQIIAILVKNRIENCKNFKDAVTSCDRFNQNEPLFKEILLEFNTTYYQKQEQEEKHSHCYGSLFGSSKIKKQDASLRMREPMSKEDWKKLSGTVGRGDLGEIARRLRRMSGG